MSPLEPYYPYVVFGSGILLAWRFHRAQVVLALALLLAADRGLRTFAAGAPATGGAEAAVFAGIGLLLPLDLALVAWLTERAVLAPAGRWALGLLLLQPLAVALLTLPELAPLAGALARSAEGGPLSPWIALPRAAVVAFAAATTLAALRFALRPTVIQSGLVWALVAAFFAVNTGAVGPASTIFLATGGLALVLSLVETSHRMAFIDELTGLPARRALNEALARLGGHYAIAMVDVDHFKRFNDAHGHAAGDQLLRMLGAALTDMPGGGRAFRYGGEEFAVLFPGKSVDEALPHLDTLRRTIEASGFTLRGADRPRKKPPGPRAAAGQRRRVSVTVSIGVADAHAESSDADEVIRAADRALYKAKRAGRNRIAI